MQEPKWQRIQFMPGHGVGPNGRRVTGCKEHIALSRKAAAEGMVLLKNEGSILPLGSGQKLAIFGKAQADYVKGGGGSGDVTCAYVRSILEGLQIKEAEGKLQLFAPLSTYYMDNVAAQRAEGKAPGFTVEPEVPKMLLEDARTFTDTAIVVICRFSSEGWDRTGTPHDGDFYLSLEEEAMLKAVLGRFEKVIVVLNVGGMVDTGWFKNEPKVKAALLAWQGGMEGGLATADILCGDVDPSGHLPDTFAVNFEAYPSSAHFNDSQDYVEYTEDIYVGYRYFETIPGAVEKVSYPFGFGLTYTSFALSEAYMLPEEAGFRFSVLVTNTGKAAGRQVVQLYCEAPQGKLGKPKKVLVGFAKTELMNPGESERIVITVPPIRFASYDDSGLVQKSAWVLEAGSYFFHVGFNVRDTEKLSYTYEVEEDTVLQQLSEKCAPKQLHQRMLADGTYLLMETDESYPRPDDDLSVLPFDGQAPSEFTWPVDYCVWLAPKGTRMIDVYEGKKTLDEFISLLSDEMKVHLLCGQPNRGPANTFGFGNIPKYGIPNAMTADGPAGLRFKEETGVMTTAFPVACVLSSSWDPKLMFEVEAAAALEVHENGIGTWLAPAINIHRTPLCGRNFEYYSEDPLLAGEMAAAAVQGIQSQGVAASLKHFA
ncbi:MAG: glycoside hydrolase family 3 C-terminal domain-containing protein, partial [Oscillospiraceae bacterium]|nr:glycoside hydrolase family 3 C-terminal domain-containing protein [Oscillospiraceae bacterium]